MAALLRDVVATECRVESAATAASSAVGSFWPTGLSRALRLDVHGRMRDAAAAREGLRFTNSRHRRPALIFRPIYGIEGIFVKHGARRRAIPRLDPSSARRT